MTPAAPGTLELPPLWSPLPSLVTSETEALAEPIARWLQTTGVCPDPQHAALMGAVGAFGTARTIPSATPQSRETMARYMAWGFALDDEHDRAADSEENLHQMIRRLARVDQIMETPELVTANDDAWVRSITDIARDLRRLAFPGALGRALTGWRSYALGAVHEASLKHTGLLPTLAEYPGFRLAHGAASIVTAMIEISTGCDIPNAEMASPIGRAAIDTAGFLFLLDNELLSYRKEAARGEHDAGLVAVLRNENPNLTLHDAFHAAIALRDHVMTIFLKFRTTFLPHASPEMRTYLQALGHCIAGVTIWTAASPRYVDNHFPTGAANAANTSAGHPWEPPIPPQITRWNQLAS